MKIFLRENQFKNIFEARMDGFRIDFLTSCKSFNEKVKYCKQMLGFPIGNGSSRLVFQLDDETCLKLAKNQKGVAQNLAEISIASDGFVSYIPKVYNGSDEENGLWIITQYVLPAKEGDFKKTMDIDFKDIKDFVLNMDRSYDRKDSFLRKMADSMIHHLYQKYEDNEEAIELLNNIHELKASYDQFVGDLSRINNWGMVRENGKVYMVALDTGLSEEVFNQFYKRR